MGYWITVVDDEPFSLTHAKNLLRENLMRVTCLRSGADLLEFVKKHTPDLILLDILMPEMDGFDTYRLLRQYEEREGHTHIPVIFLSGEDNSEAERRGLKAGASDFIRKPFDRDIMIKRINNTIENTKTIESLTEEASLDKLTGFLNKASGSEKISSLCKLNDGALLILDLDNFKLVNDLYGHDKGDRVLVAFAEIMRLNIRSEDVVCRVGGDEFMAFFPNLTTEAAVASLTDRLNQQLLTRLEKDLGEEHGLPIGISIGAAFTSQRTKDFQILFRYADSALYEVKRNGKHGYFIYDPELVSEKIQEDLDLELERVMKIMAEREEGMGALLLGQEAFSWNYRFIERFLSRYGGTATRLLFSLSSEEAGVMFSEMVSEFGNVLKNTLRKSDIIIQWQQGKYFVVLPLLSENNAQTVIDRILEKWKISGYKDRIEVKYTFSTLVKQN